MGNSSIGLLIDIDNVLEGAVVGGGKSRTGLYWTAYNIITRLLGEKNLDVTFITNRYTTLIYRDLCDVEPLFRGFHCISSLDLGTGDWWCAGPLTWLIMKRMRFKRQKRASTGLRSLANFLLYLVFTGLVKFIRGLSLFSRKNLDVLAKFDIYQSMFYRIPDFILKNSAMGKYIFVHDIIPLRKNASFRDIPRGTRSNFSKIFENLASDVGFFFNSQYTKEDFLDYFPQYRANRGLVAPLAADRKLFYRDSGANRAETDRILAKYGIPLEGKYILSLGSLNPRKNLSFLVDCFSEFLDAHPELDDLFLVLSGPIGWHTKGIFHSLENNRRHQSRIVLTGYLEDSDLNTVYSRALCFVYPSLYEGFGLPLVEAMHCGLAIIASNSTSLPEVYGDAALAIDPTDRASLLEALEKIYFDENLRHQLADRGLRRAELFSWDRTLEVLLEEYSAR
ncbi:MAG: glycosyltransferase family 4 protein [Rickettsiales bacterium]|jgi:glycosyltransferase involved in cell wall biosynthesis|nr:glycosyltransferase family 4 protein [Rickettsiales bacterium]